MNVFKHGLIKDHTLLTRLSYFIFDLMVMFLGCLFASKLKFHQWLYMPQSYENFYILAVAISMFVFYKVGLYQPMRITSFYRLSVKVIISWFLLAAILSLLAFFTKTGSSYSRIWMMWWLILSGSLHFLGRTFLLLSLGYLRKRGFNQRSILLVGDSEFCKSVVKQIAAHTGSGFFVKEVFLYEQFLTTELELQPSVSQMILNREFDQILVALPLSEEEKIKNLVHALRYSTINIGMVPDLFGLDLLNHSMVQVCSVPVINLREKPIRGYNYTTKRVFDVVFSIFAIILLLPIYSIISLLILIESGRPVLFKQKRFGIEGGEINVYKFRSMYVCKDDSLEQAKKDDARITKVGHYLRRFSLDELPQFINVLQGRMSIVGPRPHAVSHNLFYRDKVRLYMQRHMVLPGITGLAQISGYRGETDQLWKMEKRLDKDIQYINSWSIWLDIKIILLTIFKVFKDKNAY